MIDPKTTMGAVTLKVKNLDQVAAFYRDVIGLQLLEQTAASATLGTSLRPLVHLQHLPGGQFPRRSTGLYHMALRVPTRQDLANWFKHYTMMESPHWQGSADHGVSNALYLSDPEGNGIEIYWDLPQTAWPRTNDGSLTMYTRALDLRALLGEAEDKRWLAMPSQTGMGHVHLKVASIPTAKDFYVDTLGFELMLDWSGSALFVSAGGYHHHLGLNIWESQQAPPVAAAAYGLAQFEILFATENAWQATVDQLKNANYTVEIQDSEGLIRDPFNIEIALKTSHF
jgi:catechol 2,3-dioxygenase